MLIPKQQLKMQKKRASSTIRSEQIGSHYCNLELDVGESEGRNVKTQNSMATSRGIKVAL
jgi:hypothetical protein